MACNEFFDITQQRIDVTTHHGMIIPGILDKFGAWDQRGNLTTKLNGDLSIVSPMEYKRRHSNCGKN